MALLFGCWRQGWRVYPVPGWWSGLQGSGCRLVECETCAWQSGTAPAWHNVLCNEAMLKRRGTSSGLHPSA